MKNKIEQKVLLLKIKNQDPEAYGKFYDLYVKRIYRFVFFKVNSASEAQDLTSEVFLKVWQYIKDGKEIKNLKAFVYLVARNLVIDFYRDKSRQATDSAESLAEIVDERQNLAEQKNIESDLRQVLGGLERLKDEYKEIIVLKYLDELSIGEIAEVLSKKKGNVRVLLHRALTALKSNIHDSKTTAK